MSSLNRLKTLPQWAKVIITVLAVVTLPIWAAPFLLGVIFYAVHQVLWGNN